jgi:hypothetical protein
MAGIQFCQLLDARTVRSCLLGDRSTALSAAAGAARVIVTGISSRESALESVGVTLSNIGKANKIALSRHPFYSARNASSGETKLARNAGINDAIRADNPSASAATKVTTGLYGFMP